MDDQTEKTTEKVDKRFIIRAIVIIGLVEIAIGLLGIKMIMEKNSNGAIIGIAAIISVFVAFFAIAFVSSRKAVISLLITAIFSFVVGMSLTGVMLATDDKDYSKKRTDPVKDKYEQEKYLYEYYRDNPDAWNEDIGSKYGGYRVPYK